LWVILLCSDESPNADLRHFKAPTGCRTRESHYAKRIAEQSMCRVRTTSPVNGAMLPITASQPLVPVGGL